MHRERAIYSVTRNRKGRTWPLLRIPLIERFVQRDIVLSGWHWDNSEIDGTDVVIIV